MNKDLCFKFYSVLKNEDAMPFIGKNILVAADGMGGAGSTVHEIDRKKFKNLREELDECAFDDFDGDLVDESFIDYVDQLLEPMIDEASDTSALWASRIIISRFVYALCYNEKFKDCDLSDDEVRKKLSAYVRKGVLEVADHFKLESGRYSGLKVLPTTLCAIRYEENDSSVDAEVIWAGDSRCYALSPSKGLIPLSIDDEDDSGALTNYFYAGEKEATLHYRKVKIEKPCILLTVSDGIFDPFAPNDHLGVEWVFMAAMNYSSDINSYRSTLSTYFDNVRQDDATVAFVPFGFESFDDIKSSFSKRSEYIVKFWGDYQKTKESLQILSQPEDEIKGYVVQRISAKFDTLITEIITELSNGTSDIIISDELISLIDTTKTQITVKAQETEEQQKQQCYEAVISLIENEPFVFADKLAFTQDALANPDTKCKRLVEALTELKAEKEKLSVAEAALAEKQEEFDTVYDKLLSKIDAEYEKYVEHRGSTEPADVLACQIALQKLTLLCELDMHVAKRDEITKSETLAGIKNAKRPDLEKASLFNKSELSFIDVFATSSSSKKSPYSELKKAEKTEKSARHSVGLKEGNVQRAIKAFTEYFEKKQCLDIFSDEFKKEHGLIIESSEVVLNTKPSQKIKDALFENKEAVVEILVAALAKNYSKTSMVDRYFTASKLEAFRGYYSLKNDPKLEQKIQALQKALDEISDHYEGYLK